MSYSACDYMDDVEAQLLKYATEEEATAIAHAAEEGRNGPGVSADVCIDIIERLAADARRYRMMVEHGAYVPAARVDWYAPLCSVTETHVRLRLYKRRPKAELDAAVDAWRPPL